MAITVPLTPLFEMMASAASHESRLSILGDEGSESSSVADLVDQAEQRAAGLSAGGVEHGDKVCLFGRTSFDFVIGCLALWRIGAVAIPLPLRIGRRESAQRTEELMRISTQLGAKAVLWTDRDPEVPEGIPTLTSSALDGHGRYTDVGARLDDLAVIQLSSGSTGHPRGVALTHRAMAWHLEVLRRRYGPTESTDELRMICWLPMFHDMGLVNALLYPMSVGSNSWLIPTGRFVMDPMCWLTEIDRTDATLSPAPNFGYALAARRLEKSDARGLDLSRWRVAVLGGEPVREATLDRFAVAATPYGFDVERFNSAYGLAEATCALTSTPIGARPRADRVNREGVRRNVAEPDRSDTAAVFVSVGRPLDELEVMILSPEGTELGERQIGEVAATGPTLMEGYVGEPEATANALHDGVLRTGDHGYIADGELYITGRVKDMIIINGANYYAEDIETIAERVEGVRKGACIAIGITDRVGKEAVVLLTEARVAEMDTLELAKDLVKKQVWAESGLAVSDVVLLEPGVLPKTTSGKLRRHAAKKMYEEGQLSSLV